MELKLFTHHTRQEWIDTGYKYVKLTNSDEIFSDESLIEQFNLLEPYQDDSDPDSTRILPISSAQMDKIIADQSGKYK